MQLETPQLRLCPMTLADLFKAGKVLAEVAGTYGAKTPRIGFWEMHNKRKIYKAKKNLLIKTPGAWLLTTSWLLIRKRDNMLVGEAGFKGLPMARGDVEIGYGILDGFRRKGYMTEAIGALTQMAFSMENFRINRVTALTLRDNTASHRTLEKSGFTRRPPIGKYVRWEIKRQADDNI